MLITYYIKYLLYKKAEKNFYIQKLNYFLFEIIGFKYNEIKEHDKLIKYIDR